MKYLITILLLSPVLISAQTSLQGKITDLNSNSPILFGTVALMKDGNIIKGVETDFDGYYYFSDINPGIYDVEASYVGYTKNRKVAVVIKKDQSNTLNISIEQGQFDQVLGCGGYWYGRPLIEFDNTSTGAKFTSEDIRTMPIPR